MNICPECASCMHEEQEQSGDYLVCISCGYSSGEFEYQIKPVVGIDTLKCSKWFDYNGEEWNDEA